MPIQSALDAAKGLVTQIVEDEVPDLAAGLAYRFLFALFPFAIFLAALAGFAAPLLGMGDPTNEIMGALSDNLPPDVAAQLAPQLEAVLGTTRPGLLSIGALAALWAATGGVGAVIGAMNKAYDVEETRGFVARTGLALGLTILGSIGIVVAFVTIVGGSLLTERAVAGFGVGRGGLGGGLVAAPAAGARPGHVRRGGAVPVRPQRAKSRSAGRSSAARHSRRPG